MIQRSDDFVVPAERQTSGCYEFYYLHDPSPHLSPVSHFVVQLSSQTFINKTNALLPCHFFVVTLILTNVAFGVENIEESGHFNSRYNQAIDESGSAIFSNNPRNSVTSRDSRIFSSNPPREANLADNQPYQKLSERYKEKKSGEFENIQKKNYSFSYKVVNDLTGDDFSHSQITNSRTTNGEYRVKLPDGRVQIVSYSADKNGYKADIQKKNYSFSYKVVDDLTGDDFSHSQITNSRTTNGEYRVKLPDGRVQIVSYSADKNGYKADVKYTENGVERNGHQEVPDRGSSIPVRRISPTRKFHPLKTERTNYLDGTQRNSAIVKLKAVAPAALLQRYDSYESFAVIPSPAYPDEAVAVSGNLQIPVPVNVQIYTSNARDHMTGSYYPVETSSPPPFFYDDSNNYQQPVMSPEIITNGDHGIISPGSTPSSFVLTDKHGQVIDNIRLVTTTAIPVVFASNPATPNGRHFVGIRSTAEASSR
uniref:Cuticular protein 132 n=1 Tax=Leptinotarsa decemlineata TaxID=7539 RepID=A0A3S7SJR3_LEPDE|nr:cuticular protein 132 [Leptinotarsa decemlineata]